MAMADLTFDLEYDGPALQAHEMNVRDLAPALVATADLFQEMNRVVRPTDPPVSVNLRATSTGSFLVDLTLLYDAAVVTLTGPGMNALLNLTQLLTLLRGLIQLRKHKAEADVEATESTPAGTIRVRFSNGSEIEIPPEVLDLDNNKTVRSHLTEVVKPLSKEGVEIVRFRQEDIILGEVTRSELPAFTEPTAGSETQQLLSDERTMHLQIISPTFIRGNKWRFSDGRAPFWAKVLDEAFLDRVDRKEESFVSGDILRCIVRDVQKTNEEGLLVTETELLRVLEHRHPPSQESMFDSGEDG